MILGCTSTSVISGLVEKLVSAGGGGVSGCTVSSEISGLARELVAAEEWRWSRWGKYKVCPSEKEVLGEGLVEVDLSLERFFLAVLCQCLRPLATLSVNTSRFI